MVLSSHCRWFQRSRVSDRARYLKLEDRQMGNKKITIQNLEVVRVDAEKNLLLVKGSVPGPKKSLVTIKETVKSGK